MEKKQVHVEIPRELHEQLKALCPEVGQISILTRRLYRAFIRHKNVTAAGRHVAERWDEE
jgi:hypothetical protein